MISFVAVALLGQITIYSNGTRLSSRATEVNCSGSGATCSMSGNRWTLSVSATLADGGVVGGVTGVTATAPIASSGGTAPVISLTGTVSEARGGTGTGALTCTSGQALTSNGTAQSCTSTLTASDVSCSACINVTSEVTGVLPEANGGTGTTALHCGNNGYLWSDAGAYGCASFPACTNTAQTRYAVFDNGSGPICTNQLAGGLDTQLQYNNSSVLAGITNATSDGIVLIIGNDAGTGRNTSDGVALYAQRWCDWSELMAIGPQGGEFAIAETNYDKPWVLLKPSGTSNLSCFGNGCSSGTATTTGTITQPAQTIGGDDWEYRFRTQLQTAASTNANANTTGTGSSNSLGAFNTTKGLKFWAQFNSTRTNANARIFAGVRDPVVTMFPNTNPSAFLQAAGCYMDSDQSTLHLLSSGPDAGSTTSDCGSSFTVRDAGTAFTCRFMIPPGGGSICFALTNESLGTTCLLRSATAVPASTYPMTFLVGTNTATTAAVTNLETTGVYVTAASR